MKPAVPAAMAIVLLSSAAAAEDRREADAHEHGHGTFEMAIEGGRVEIAVAVPAFDVVGFEHAPSTADHRAAIAGAAAALGRPDRLFRLPDAAECALARIGIAFGAVAGDDHGEDHDDHAGHDDHDDDAHDDGDGGTHSEVTASYALACANPGALDRVAFGWFEVFPRAEELEVVVLSGAGQGAGEVDRSAPVFEIE